MTPATRALLDNGGPQRMHVNSKSVGMADRVSQRRKFRHAGFIYKVLPETSLAWRDVAAGAIVTAILFNVGKLLINRIWGVVP
jgi:hypothetical protein